MKINSIFSLPLTGEGESKPLPPHPVSSTGQALNPLPRRGEEVFWGYFLSDVASHEILRSNQYEADGQDLSVRIHLIRFFFDSGDGC